MKKEREGSAADGTILQSEEDVATVSVYLTWETETMEATCLLGVAWET